MHDMLLNKKEVSLVFDDNRLSYVEPGKTIISGASNNFQFNIPALFLSCDAFFIIKKMK